MIGIGARMGTVSGMRLRNGMIIPFRFTPGHAGNGCTAPCFASAESFASVKIPSPVKSSASMKSSSASPAVEPLSRQGNRESQES